jgi:hypothetical protein
MAQKNVVNGVKPAVCDDCKTEKPKVKIVREKLGTEFYFWLCNPCAAGECQQTNLACTGAKVITPNFSSHRTLQTRWNDIDARRVYAR